MEGKQKKSWYGAVGLRAMGLEVCGMSYGGNGNLMREWTTAAVFSSLASNLKGRCWVGAWFCAVLEFGSVFGENSQSFPFWENLLGKVNTCRKCATCSFFLCGQKFHLLTLWQFQLPCQIFSNPGCILHLSQSPCPLSWSVAMEEGAPHSSSVNGELLLVRLAGHHR